jgi:tRNA splicing endonuclease
MMVPRRVIELIDHQQRQLLSIRHFFDSCRSVLRASQFDTVIISTNGFLEISRTEWIKVGELNLIHSVNRRFIF